MTNRRGLLSHLKPCPILFIMNKICLNQMTNTYSPGKSQLYSLDFLDRQVEIVHWRTDVRNIFQFMDGVTGSKYITDAIRSYSR